MSEQITFRIPQEELASLDEVVEGRYRSRADAIRAALKLFVREEQSRLIAESYRRAYQDTPQEEWIGEAGAASFGEVLSPVSSTRREAGRCECGCGGQPRRGRFLPGHDAKLMSKLKTAAAAGDPGAVSELERRGWA
jgi:Arc/MetJ-type ribon-helix-helix transcriptional regulator